MADVLTRWLSADAPATGPRTVPSALEPEQAFG